MTSEQKIKAYDEAFDKAIVAYKDEDRHLKATLERIFPELKELRDEMIRKTLIELVKCNERSGYTLFNNVPTSSMLVWLEKQKEPKLSEDLGEYVVELSKQFPEVSFGKIARIAVRVKNWLEKQGDKPKDYSSIDPYFDKFVTM